MFVSRYYFAMRVIEEAVEADRREWERRYLRERREILNINRISDKKFIQLYRLSKRAFNYLCQILKENTNLKKSRRVFLETKVLCALLFYANGDYQRVIGEANYLSQEAVSRYINEVTEALNHPYIINKFIKFPCSLEDRRRIKQSFYDKYGFPGVIGCIDASHFRIVKPKRNEEHIYYCRKHFHSLNVQVVSDHQGRILAVNPKYGGASHDSFIWSNSKINTFMKTLHQNGESVWLLGDSGYPQRPWLMTPYINPTPNSVQETYNKVHGKTRVIIENTFGRLKNRWRCLNKDRVLHYKPEKCAKIILACAVLHNIALDFKVTLPEDQMLENLINVGQSTLLEQAEDDTSMLFLGRRIRDGLATRLHTATI